MKQDLMLCVPYPSTAYVDELCGLLGERCVLVFSYPTCNSGIAYQQHADTIGRETKTTDRIEHGVNYLGATIRWYSIELRWVVLRHDIVEMIGHPVCVCPVAQKAVADFNSDN